MFKLIWAAITGGSPVELIGLVVGALALVTVSAGFGYYEATQQCERNLIAHTDVVQAAQAKHDQTQANNANTASTAADTRQKAGDAAVKPILQFIHDQKVVTVTVPADPHACDLKPEILDALNKAGQQ